MAQNILVIDKESKLVKTGQVHQCPTHSQRFKEDILELLNVKTDMLINVLEFLVFNIP